MIGELLQIAFIAAKPDFGVDVMIRGSGAVKGTAVLIEQQFLELTGHMNFMLGDLATSVAPFVQSLCDDEMPCSLEGTVNQIVQLLTPDQDQVAASLLEQFNDLGDYDVNTLAGTTFNRTYDLALNLAFVTVINGPYAMYCFNKYAHLVEQLMPRVTDGLIVCFREELTRLRSLQTSLINMYVTLVYDLEDLVEYLQLCTLSPVPSRSSTSNDTSRVYVSIIFCSLDNLGNSVSKHSFNRICPSSGRSFTRAANLLWQNSASGLDSMSSSDRLSAALSIGLFSSS
uniref:Uncharacterized protein n=1 Tax=Anopheles epiroticus TaxID=199890 RepID=A0A182P227_9DIPT